MSDPFSIADDLRFYAEGLARKNETQAARLSADTQEDLKTLNARVQRLALLNQALWELLCERLGMSDADLERKACEVDLRDGAADGRITAKAVRCPQCNRVNNSRHRQCMYCATPFETMPFE